MAARILDSVDINPAPLRIVPSSTIWVVGDGDRIFIRSTNGRTAAWLRGAVASGGGQTVAQGTAYDVVFTEAEDDDLAAVDAAYRAKYSRYASIVDHLEGAGPRSATLQVHPAWPTPQQETRMRGTIIHAPFDVRLEERPEPTISQPTDAVVRTVATCVCGSDLWRYRGIQEVKQPTPIGHEYVGIVEAVGDAVTTVKPGQFVVGGFLTIDNTCSLCRAGAHANCQNGTGYDGCRASWRSRTSCAPGGTPPSAPTSDLGAPSWSSGTERLASRAFSRPASSATQALQSARPGAMVGWDRRIEPSKVFDLLPLDQVAEAYAAMDQRRATKVLLRP